MSSDKISTNRPKRAPLPEAGTARPRARSSRIPSIPIDEPTMAEPIEAIEEIMVEESVEIAVAPEVVDYQRMGRFDTAFELASGGFASVYLARARGPGGFEKFVALKRIHEHLASQKDFVEMFLDEARIAATISHPCICSVIDFGESANMYYLAMEYIMGEPLSKVMPRLRRNASLNFGVDRFALFAKMVADAADGLHAAHTALGPDGQPLGVVHRDVAPVNIFLRYDGHIQIVDFGIAKAKGKMHATAAGVMKGHMSYMSPEQFRGDEVDLRTDIWALGVILWELCFNARLYKRDSDVNTMLAVLSEPIQQRMPPAANVPSPLRRIIVKCLEKDPKARFQNARELASALYAYVFQSEVPVTSTELSTVVATLFPGGYHEKCALIEQARAALTAQKPEHSGVASAAGPSAAGHAASEQPSNSEVPSPVLPQENAHQGGNSRMLLGAFASSMLTAMLLAGGVYYLKPSLFAAEPAPQVPAAPATGQVEIRLAASSKVKTATVYQGQEALGQTPLALTLPAGLHDLRMEANGFDPLPFQVTVSPGMKRRIVLQLGGNAP